MGLTKNVDFSTAKLLKEKGYRLLPEFESSYPTIAKTIMWLYEKHGIWVVVERVDPNGLFNYVIVYQDNVAVKESRGKGYKAPTEAYLEAIDYTLKNLIK